MFLRPRLFHRLSIAFRATYSFRAASKRSIHSESTNAGSTHTQKLVLGRYSAVGDSVARPDAPLHHLADKELVKAFFKAARKSNATDAAEVICKEFQSTSVLDHYSDCFLRNGVLPWLLSHLVFNAKNRQLGKDILQVLVRTKENIMPHERGDIIALCAAGGYASETRALWERYSVGRDVDMVTGHTKCLVGIVKLFERIAAKNRHRLSHKVDDMEGTKETSLGGITSSVTQGQLTECGVGTDHIKFTNKLPRDAIVNEKPRSKFDLADELSSGVKTTESFNSSVDVSDGRQVETVTKSHPSAETDLSGAEEMENGAISDVDADEYYVFSRKVVDTYQRAKEPLTQASHYDLNALAHCSEVLGMVRIGMRALQIVVDRKEVPDTRDLNVVIRAMATRDAVRAEEMLMRMLHEGLHLNGHSFASVILGWLQCGQIARASRIYARAIRAGHAKLPSDPARALMCACLDASRADASQSQADGKMQRTLLRHVYLLISSGACSRSSMPRERCVQCVNTATRQEEAGLAFYFWKQLLKTNRRKESAEETELRKAVAVLIRRAMGSGAMNMKEGKRMVTELGDMRGD